MSKLPSTRSGMLNTLQRMMLVGAASANLLVNPWRDDLVAAIGELTGSRGLATMRHQILEHAPHILEEKPFINAQTLQEQMQSPIPENSLLQHYMNWCSQHHVPLGGNRADTRFLDDEDDIYVMKRYRQFHDWFHVLLNYGTGVEYEVGQKLFEFAQTNLCMNLAAFLVPTVLPTSSFPMERRAFMMKHIVPHALENAKTCKPMVTVELETMLLLDIDDVREEIGLIPFDTNKDTRRNIVH